jgi:hypothetical protein
VDYCMMALPIISTHPAKTAGDLLEIALRQY